MLFLNVWEIVLQVLLAIVQFAQEQQIQQQQSNQSRRLILQVQPVLREVGGFFIQSVPYLIDFDCRTFNFPMLHPCMIQANGSLEKH